MTTRLLVAAATLLLALSIVASVTSSIAYASVLQITPMPPELRTPGLLEDESFLTLNITYWNGTTAIVDEVILNFESSDEIVQLINEKIREEQELPIITESDSEPEEELEESDNDENGGGSDDDTNNDNDNGDSDEPEPIEPILPIPGPPEDGNGTEGGEEGLGLELELEQKILTDGCFEDHGYYENGPYECFPIKNGELQLEPPENSATCLALGCPWNPPAIDLSKD
jgi:hypothetical protein